MALLLIDFMNPFDFPNGAALARHAIGAARRTAALKARMRARHAPVIYANDNFGRWESDFAAVVAHCSSRGGASAAIARMLAPGPGDRSILKPRHSAFFGTPLEFLLDELSVDRLVLTGLAFRWTRWGRYLFAIGGNERAATLTGVPVKAMKVSVYMFCALCAGLTGILEVGWLGTISTSLGQGMELSVIAAAVIGGANLMGGAGTAFGAVVGAALIEVIRNSLILLGISTFWQGTFVGSFIIVAVLFDRLRAASASD